MINKNKHYNIAQFKKMVIRISSSLCYTIIYKYLIKKIINKMKNIKLLKKEQIFIFVSEDMEYPKSLSNHMSNYWMQKSLEIPYLDINAKKNNKFNLFKITTSKNKEILLFIIRYFFNSNSIECLTLNYTNVIANN